VDRVYLGVSSLDLGVNVGIVQLNHFGLKCKPTGRVKERRPLIVESGLCMWERPRVLDVINYFYVYT